MRKNYLFPTTFRKIGWCLFVPFAITSFICLFDGSNEDWLKVNALSVIPWGIIKNSLFDELSMIGLTVSLLFIAFSKEKDEDECIANIRSNSLIWATITAYSLLIVCTMLIYDMQYLNFVFIDLFMILFLFIIKYNIELYKFRRSNNDSKVEGTYFPDSMALMVCRLTPMASANCCWVICLMALSTLNVLVIENIRDIRKDCK